MRMIRSLFAPAVLLFGSALPVVAQADPLGSAGLGRPYWHVFLAYAIAILLIGGWVVSIARRLAHIERRLPDSD